MPTVIPVKFAYATRDLWFDPKDSHACAGDHVICSTERGTEIGLATDDPREMSGEELSRSIGKSSLKSVLRVATDDDLDRAEEQAERADDAFPVFRRLVTESGLDMKPVGVEYLFGGEKVVCYFAAEERVDFRQLVRELSRELHERIDMRQIGVREEAAFIGGFGHCGQELCCARFGLSFEPVSIRMAKEQDLPLTSNKISGACGRLMCCLRYEFEAYRDFKGRAPKRNAVIDTPLGKAKVVEYDTPKEELALRIENGKVVRIPLAEMVASEAAVKKSEELHCPCRPDTVVRESLDKLSSPDVQMALAELDRKMGIVADEGIDDTDIFVESKPRRKRSRRRSGSGGSGGAGQDAAKTQNAQKATAATSAQQPDDETARKPRRRRRKRGGGAADGAAVQQGQQQQVAQAQKSGDAAGRRRRHHSQGGQSQGGQGQGQDAKGGQGQGKQAQNKQQKPKRRPGDRGGVKGGQQNQQGADQRADQQGQAPKRRRRRRRRGGGGQGDNGNAGTSAE